jgi:branched-chain amino acid transport system ATP-binding protein
MAVDETSPLALAGLYAGYGALRVVQNLSFSLEPGTLTALLGANGAGKSTALGAVSGAVARQGGAITTFGQAVPASPEHVAARGIAQVPQGRRVFGSLTVAENLLSGTAHLDRGAARTEVESVFARLPLLQRLADRRAGLLSGGEQQLVAIGRALAGRPRVLMIDELSLGLAPKVVSSFEPLLRNVVADGMTVLLVEQHAAFALRCATRVLVMSQGRLVRDAPAGALDEAELLHESYLGVTAVDTDRAI